MQTSHFPMLWIGSVLLILSVEVAYAQCDGQVIADENQASFRYKDRGAYCEGLIIKPASSNRIQLIQYTEGSFDYDLTRDRTLVIHTRYQNGPIRVRVEGVKVSSFYRLDGYLQPGRSILWDMQNVIIPNRMRAEQLGVYGFIPDDGRNFSRTFVPVYITKSGNTNPGGKYSNSKIVLLRSNKKLEDVQWRLILGNEIITPWASVDRRGLVYFPADRPISIPIQGNATKKSANYELEVAYKISGDKNYVVNAFQLWFD